MFCLLQYTTRKKNEISPNQRLYRDADDNNNKKKGKNERNYQINEIEQRNSFPRLFERIETIFFGSHKIAKYFSKNTFCNYLFIVEFDSKMRIFFPIDIVIMVMYLPIIILF